jgi:hypothetical protein
MAKLDGWRVAIGESDGRGKRPVWPQSEGMAQVHCMRNPHPPPIRTLPLEIGTHRRDVSTLTRFSLIKGLILDGKNRTQLRRPHRPRAPGAGVPLLFSQPTAS